MSSFVGSMSKLIVFGIQNRFLLGLKSLKIAARLEKDTKHYTVFNKYVLGRAVLPGMSIDKWPYFMT